MLSRLFLVKGSTNGKDKSIYVRAENMADALDLAIFYFSEDAVITGIEMKMSLLFEPDEEALP